jgi:hypothetical protein
MDASLTFDGGSRDAGAVGTGDPSSSWQPPAESGARIQSRIATDPADPSASTTARRAAIEPACACRSVEARLEG